MTTLTNFILLIGRSLGVAQENLLQGFHFRLKPNILTCSVDGGTHSDFSERVRLTY